MTSSAHKILTIVLVLTCATLVSLADRGAGKKSKAKTNLNIATTSTLKSSISLNLKSGLSYKGSLVSSTQSGNSLVLKNVVTYQKGNTTYILPYKSKVTPMPDMRQGYGGVKLIIRRN